MTDHEVRVGDAVVVPADGWTLAWDDRASGLARLLGPGRSIPVVVEGAGTDWMVTLRGRRIPVTVRSWRERVLADAETEARAHSGPMTVPATLPGLVVAVTVAVGDEVVAGTSLLTIEAMKMQNEVRAPRDGTVLEVAVATGDTVAAGAPLVRLA
jgi:acetyl/propionyl-CoA carboxylase alpha subunit